MSIVADAEEYAALLNAAGGRKCYTDPARAANNRPCFLLAPPSLDFTTRAVSWRLVALAGSDEPSLRALQDLDELVSYAQTNSPVPIEAAEAASYPLSSERPPVPAYLLRFTTSTEEL